MLPELVMMFTAPDDVSEVETSSEDREIWNWLSASFEMFAVVVPTVSSVTSTPSTCTRVPVPERPLIETAR